MKTVSARQANHEFSDLLSRVERGEEILITKRSKPVAFLRPYRPPLLTAERVNGFPDVPDRYPRFTDRHTIELRKGPSNSTHDGKKAIQHVIDVMSKGLPWGPPYKGSTATTSVLPGRRGHAPALPSHRISKRSHKREYAYRS